MTVKTFRAPNMMAALNDIQRQLGPDALVVSVRQVTDGAAWKLWKRPGVEVLAMDSAGPAPAASPAEEKTPPARAEIEPLVAGLSARLARPDSPEQPAELPAALEAVQRRLLDQGVDEILVRKIATACAESLSPRSLQDEQRVRKQLASQLQVYLRTRPGNGVAEERVICLVGMSGSGKTSTAAKLAAYYARKDGRRIAWICADTVRAGAIAEARVYTESLGIPLRLAYTSEELAETAKEVEADLVLVDTPGCNPHREASVIELAALLTSVPKRSTYLIAPATARATDLARAVAALSPFSLRGLVVTKLDETDRFGDIFNLAWRSQIPLAYITSGTRPLEDLQPATAGQLVAALLGGS
jgi:flagellar biosynthesis protein FlhF